MAVPVAPGHHHVHVHVPYVLPSRIGSADLAVTTAPGQSVELEYRAPMIAFLSGSLGTPPQEYNGMTASVVILAITAMIFLCACGGVFFAALADA